VRRHIPWIVTALALFGLVLPSAQTVISNNAADMANHIVMVADSPTPRTVTNLFTFNRGGTLAPFAVGNAGAVTVTNLDADLLDGLNSTRFVWAVVSTTSTGTQNDFAPGIASGQPTLIRANNASDLTVTGLSGGVDGQIVCWASIGAGNVILTHQTAGSSAANRFINYATCASPCGTPLAAGVGTACQQYDGTTARWRLTHHNQGQPITPTYNGANYTATSGTWTVDAGDVTTESYFLAGRMLTVTFYLVTTSTSATPVTLQINNGAWGGFTAAKAALNAIDLSDNGGGNIGGFANITAGLTLIGNTEFAASSPFAVAANTTNVLGQLTFEIQ